MSKVLYKQNEQTVPANFRAQFGFKGTNYRVEMELGLVAALASIPCQKCAKTTRDILKDLGVVNFSANDQEVDVLEIVSNLPDDRDRSVFDPGHVSVITQVFIQAIEDIDAMIEVPMGDELGKALEAHVEKILNGMIICDGCLFDAENYVEKLLAV